MPLTPTGAQKKKGPLLALILAILNCTLPHPTTPVGADPCSAAPSRVSHPRLIHANWQELC
jgi:hypothetical protein